MPFNDSNLEALKAEQRAFALNLLQGLHSVGHAHCVHQSDCIEATYTLDCMHGCTMTSDPSANDD